MAQVNKKKLWWALSIVWVVGVALYNVGHVGGAYHSWKIGQSPIIIGLRDSLGNWRACVEKHGARK